MGLFDIFTNSDQNAAKTDQTNAINTGYSQLSDLFNQGRSAINTNYDAAATPFANNLGVAQGGQQMLAQLLGIPGSGPNGSTPNMQDVLSRIPGFQFALDQGSENVLRNQAATGQLNSGATNIDLQKLGQGMASQNYFNYVNQLQPFLGAANNAASGYAGVKTGQGNALNTNLTGQGNAAAGAQTAIGNASANADLAGLTASGNLWGALIGAGKAGAQAAPLLMGA